MNAVTTKPRGKAAAKATKPNMPAKPDEAIKWIVCALQDAEQLAETGISAGGEPGELGGRLLWLATTYGFPRVHKALRADAYTSDTVNDALNEIFDVQALIAGAAAMHGRDGRGTLASMANALIESISEGMDRPQFWPSAPVGQPSDFEKGRDLAVALLREAKDFDGSDEAEVLRCHRHGNAQERFALGYLHDLIEDPARVQGFAAVLSAKLAAPDVADISCFDVSEAEYEGGIVGADGTLVGDVYDAGIAARESCATAQPEAEPQAGSEHVGGAILDALAEGANAVSVLRAAAHDSTDAHWGILALARLALEAIETAKSESIPEAFSDRLSDASCLYAQAIAVCSAVNTDILDDELLHAGESLLVLAKQHVDDAIGRAE